MTEPTKNDSNTTSVMTTRYLPDPVGHPYTVEERTFHKGLTIQGNNKQALNDKIGASGVGIAVAVALLAVWLAK